MMAEEKLNFTSLLQNLQEWHESAEKKGPIRFHADARASLWGAALAKIADHYRGVGRNEKTMFFMSAAWHISKYPIFAYNMALLSMAEGDDEHAKILLETYLAECKKVMKTPVLRLVNPEIREEKLEKLAESARAKLAMIQSA
jgi:hypothetical protein